MKYFRWILYLVVIALLVLFVPIYPTSFISHDDPVNITDKRVNVKISTEDLQQIVFVVRGENLISLYDYFWYMMKNDILSISESKEKVSYKSFQNELVKKIIPPTGKVIVTVGYSCGRLCGSGITFYLDEVDGKWVILDYRHWIS